MHLPRFPLFSLALGTASTLWCAGAAAQNIGLYLSPPGEQNTTRSGAVVENFDRGAGNIGSAGTWAVGSYTAAAGRRDNAGIYGGAGGTGQYLAVDSGPINVTLTGTPRYVGFWWSAGDASNNIAFYDSNNNLLASFTTASLLALLSGSGNVTAIDGNQYPKAAYFGNPNPPAGRNVGEPYGYVNLLIQGSSATFSRIVITGNNFELDNLAAADVAAASDTWVNYGNLPVTPPPGSIGATDDTAVTRQNAPFNGDVSANDTTVPGSTFSKATDPVHGTVVVNPDGTYTYTPVPGYSGKDSFTYQQCKPAPDQAVCVTATVRVTVSPDAVDDEESTGVNTPVNSTVAGNDVFEPGSTFTQGTGPGHGTLTFNPDGSYLYTPANGYSGSDSFTYQVCLPPPNAALCDTATVTITIAPATAPVASNVTAGGTPQPGQTLTGGYTYSDINGDLEGQSTSRWVINNTPSSPTGGTQVSNARSYTPTTGDVGNYLFYCVTPVAVTGAPALVGAEVCSPAVQVTALSAGGTQSIPTLSEWGMLLLSALMTAGAWLGLRRRS